MGDTEALSWEVIFKDPCTGLSSNDCRQHVMQQYTGENGPLSGYEVLATGVGRDADGPFIAVAFVYSSSAGAAGDISVFEEVIRSGSSLRGGRQWRDFFPDAEIWSEGRALLAKLRTDRPSMWANPNLRIDSLFVHE